MSDVELIKETENKYCVLHAGNNNKFGSIERSSDGYFYFWVDGGCLPAYILRAVANELDKLNSKHDEELCNSLNK